MVALKMFYPNIEAYSADEGYTYESIVFVNETNPPSKAQLEQDFLTWRKRVKIEEISEACRQSIVSGFVSDALGTAHLYDSDIEDQINLAGAYIVTLPNAISPSSSSIPYVCRNQTTMIKSYIAHTNEQLLTVLQEGAARKLSLLQLFNQMRDDINAATELEYIEAVTWIEPQL